MKNILVILLCFFAYFGMAQADASAEAVVGMGIGNSTLASSSVMTNTVRSVKPGTVNPSFENITGSAYLTDFFLPSKLYYDGEFMKNIYYRFNAYNGEIEVKQNSTPTSLNVASLNKDKKIAILVNNNKMSFKTFVTSKKKTLNGYLIMLLDGKDYDLYKREYVIFSPGRVSTNSFVKAVPNRFTNFTEYYFQKEGVNRIDEILPNNRQFLKLIDNDKRAALKEYLKENKLNAKEESDLIKTFKHLNQ
ncbi:hypothetical protein [Maribacter sp. HTCC2170]|uniref:hypothetical protein n=1 Tax=Maribacter sp. (strain HTCC2170 / KCCM 42371) TaxID=313603 RepID=UPI00006BD503|nr:hypothetical protein [Maribacter sp. HTCC2170]EAR02130.1 hypothetical protein FB2170_02565 [Maribacter sp. HTCC2170]